MNKGNHSEEGRKEQGGGKLSKVGVVKHVLLELQMGAKGWDDKQIMFTIYMLSAGFICVLFLLVVY